METKKLLAKITKLQKEAFENVKFHRRNNNKYGLCNYFEGKRSALRQVKKIIKK